MSTERHSLEIETLATPTPSASTAPVGGADGISFGVAAPEGGVERSIQEWNYDICGCRCSWLCCVTFVCPLVVHAQLMQRLNLTLGGCRRRVGSSTTTRPVCPTLVAIFYGSCFLMAVLWLANAKIAFEIALDAFGVLGVFCLVAMVNTRMSFQETYNILPHTQNCYEDCCITLCCGPCSAIQMTNHDNRSYAWCSTTGEIVV
mmetsp:Transcript_11044/g.22876  ORF Transcript_11044/g.22876 Transcript_11044/m.22876 type:complete len:203 (-) Transcript_11044:34-642(-)|eukprot:CAMPEP_0197272600 /NCGR_PEP_ID=MMETSP1432-20130617/10118_1 /TAXON_ID=44447 /ORGANISM="Pseudo-nitzschia delicatissima, Strain UNC1205" /LENGTH=202 /DNA_ID=CAMNT_0042738163 /DNA_START=53 /DNA_END=661 /DNA_ORIENTATION=+